MTGGIPCGTLFVEVTEMNVTFARCEKEGRHWHIRSWTVMGSPMRSKPYADAHAAHVDLPLAGEGAYVYECEPL